MNAQNSRPDDLIDQSSQNKYSALSGDDNLGDLPGDATSEDYELRNAIRAKLEDLIDGDLSGLDISVRDGFVSLTGFVDHLEHVNAIRSAVEEMDGVVDVVCLLRAN